jgi:hypothetical protein
VLLIGVPLAVPLLIRLNRAMSHAAGGLLLLAAAAVIAWRVVELS